MKSGIGNIYLAWRKGSGHRRIIIGIIHRNATSGTTFEYDQKAVEEASSQGFVQYPDFPDVSKVYDDNVLEIFGQRLNKSEREDIMKYYSYWEIDPAYKDDKYYLLAHTQGILPTDNFEFLAEYLPTKDLSFVSELCGLTQLQLPSNSLKEDDILTWRLDPQNKYDDCAVKLYKGDLFVGYVKKIHSKVFYHIKKRNIHITVKSVHKNGHINRAIIKIFQ